ncbi:hypothetical protein MMC22_005173 [Lobaria immixta]|nr:hypothetical protein [Lobaria immixta]
MRFLLPAIVFLILGDPILSESPNSEITATNPDTPSLNAESDVDTLQSNAFESGNSGGLGVKSKNTDSSAFDLSFNAITSETSENLLMNPDPDPNASDRIIPASAGPFCLNDPITGDTTQNVKRKRQSLLADWFPNWSNPVAPDWCPRGDTNGPLLPKPQRPSLPSAVPSSPPASAPSSPPASPPPAPLLKPDRKPITDPQDDRYPDVDGGSEYGEVRNCRNNPNTYNYVFYSTVICGGPPYPQDYVDVAKNVEDCYRCTYFAIFSIVMNSELDF